MHHFLLAILSTGTSHAIPTAEMQENPVYPTLEDLKELDPDPRTGAVTFLAWIGVDRIQVQGTLVDLAIEALVMIAREFGQSRRLDGQPIQAARILIE